MAATQDNQALLADIFAQMGARDKALKVERFRRLNPYVRKGQVLFCGSSLMEQFPIEEFLRDAGSTLTVYNRGVGGFTTSEMLEALGPCVFDLEPAHIFINIGTNDLNGPDYTLSGLISRYRRILSQIKGRLPQAALHLLAYYPVNEEAGMRDPGMGEVFRFRTNERIREANRAVEELAREVGGAYHDLNQGITDEMGRLKEAYTVEGMHMYPDGYYQVFQQLLPVLNGLELG